MSGATAEESINDKIVDTIMIQNEIIKNSNEATEKALKALHNIIEDQENRLRKIELREHHGDT